MSHKYSSLPTGNTITSITISIITVTITLGEYDEYGHNSRGSNYNSNNGNYIDVSTNLTHYHDDDI